MVFLQQLEVNVQVQGDRLAPHCPEPRDTGRGPGRGTGCRPGAQELPLGRESEACAAWRWTHGSRPRAAPGGGGGRPGSPAPVLTACRPSYRQGKRTQGHFSKDGWCQKSGGRDLNPGPAMSTAPPPSPFYRPCLAEGQNGEKLVPRFWTQRPLSHCTHKSALWTPGLSEGQRPWTQGWTENGLMRCLLRGPHHPTSEFWQTLPHRWSQAPTPVSTREPPPGAACCPCPMLSVLGRREWFAGL